VTWHRWQRLCAWGSLAAGVAWTVKFVLLLATDGDAGAAEPLTDFIFPTLGSTLGLIGAFGIAAPLVGGRRAVVSVPVTIVTALLVVFLVSAVSDAVQGSGPVSASGNVVVRTETSALVSGLLWLAAAAWLFFAQARRGRSTSVAE
jgi:hypothetical protein